LTFHNYADNLVISLVLKGCSQKNRRLPMKKICPGIKRGAVGAFHTENAPSQTGPARAGAGRDQFGPGLDDLQAAPPGRHGEEALSTAIGSDLPIGPFAKTTVGSLAAAMMREITEPESL
jgi:hypothetical protein